MGGLNVKRIVYVPESGGDYARFLEVLDNPGTSAVTTTVAISGNLGSDGGTIITSTSSGDTSATTDDQWFATDDGGGPDPALAHVFQGMSATITAESVSVSYDSIGYSWNVTVPAGGRIAIMHFAVMKPTQEDSWAEAMQLAEAPDDVLVGIDDYLDDIQNFSIATPGAPRVRFTGPFSSDEGSPVTLTVAVEDLEGDSFTYAWDVDGDGTFEEMPGESSYTVPEGTTDGPGAVRIGVSATDDAGNTTERYRTVNIQNVDPRITSHPPLTTSVGADLRYTIEVEDPAGAMDPPTFAVVEGPDRMVVSPEGVVQWTPADSDVTAIGTTLTVRVSVNDGDGGTTEQSWEMTVSPNHAPMPPIPAFPVDMLSIADETPRLATANAHDLDLDPLTYQFEIDTVDTFDSPDLRQSGALEETPGFTAWQIEDPLQLNRIYYWRVWASDGMADSEIRQTGFYLVRDPSLGPPDAGPVDGGPSTGGDGGVLLPEPDAGTVPPSGGCSVGASEGGGSAAWLLAGLAGLALAIRRRRR
jgi:MYXO-CTERM domain-containing protein